jgi:hypothetical protein
MFLAFERVFPLTKDKVKVGALAMKWNSIAKYNVVHEARWMYKVYLHI